MSGFTPDDVKAFLDSTEHLLIGVSTAVRDVVALRRAKAMDPEERAALEKEEASFLIGACDGDRDALVAAAARLIGAIEMMDRAKTIAAKLIADAGKGDAA